MSNRLDLIYSKAICWQMSTHERIALDWLCSQIKVPHLAVEIGSYYGGSLQVLSKYFKSVISIDINHDKLAFKSNNVELITGDSKVVVPELVSNLMGDDEEVNLFLIDANHEFDYVLSDLNSVLQYEPKEGQGPIYILMHDSWYTPTRQAIFTAAPWDNQFVDLVDFDFCHGNLVKDNMPMGGLCLIRMQDYKCPEKALVMNEGDPTYMRLTK